MKIYISGPMRGIKNDNKEAFYFAERRLQERHPDAVIFNPARADDEDPIKPGSPVQMYAARDLKELLNCTTIYLLNGWEDSFGATAEAGVAKWLGLDFWFESGEGT